MKANIQASIEEQRKSYLYPLRAIEAPCLLPMAVCPHGEVTVTLYSAVDQRGRSRTVQATREDSNIGTR